ncbi:uncharacterized protein MONOS_14619 [Monocercomonoides exilis]|uniref:uncharacterized protein n=1 Tax=Monocercomonoides exilis TaxID=2049356 RepID=UPI0035593FA9|nr:hypothetical protein MONOS_14619 [Monocercomonoides exilis]|eukprot:MONOS_14619.1-p1 / transcript=MONOS_14619.1 / gene=MONOS_14619 / organism=Monocercomonoides_exilis_PA203 / gene_product=unspecified product / transcript_product=unspecified product / location=Mono_scaffold01036:4801-5669(+) / protein_length=241 / sequence_SO=supercontig / SO=protein_coding / is_pseudo=false
MSVNISLLVLLEWGLCGEMFFGKAFEDDPSEEINEALAFDFSNSFPSFSPTCLQQIGNIFNPSGSGSGNNQFNMFNPFFTDNSNSAPSSSFQLPTSQQSPKSNKFQFPDFAKEMKKNFQRFSPFDSLFGKKNYKELNPAQSENCQQNAQANSVTNGNVDELPNHSCKSTPQFVSKDDQEQTTPAGYRWRMPKFDYTGPRPRTSATRGGYKDYEYMDPAAQRAAFRAHLAELERKRLEEKE